MKGNNGNHPKKGSRITVEPIRKVRDIQSIKKMLSDEPRNLLLFTLGVNNGLRAGDLLRTRVMDLRGLRPGDSIQIVEGKTGKTNILVLNKESHRVLRRYLEEVNPRKGTTCSSQGRAGTVPSLWGWSTGWSRDGVGVSIYRGIMVVILSGKLGGFTRGFVLGWTLPSSVDGSTIPTHR